MNTASIENVPKTQKVMRMHAADLFSTGLISITVEVGFPNPRWLFDVARSFWEEYSSAFL